MRPVQNAFQKLSCSEQRREGVAAYLWFSHRAKTRKGGVVYIYWHSELTTFRYLDLRIFNIVGRSCATICLREIQGIPVLVILGDSGIKSLGCPLNLHTNGGQEGNGRWDGGPPIANKSKV